MKRPYKTEQYSDFLARLFPEEVKNIKTEEKHMAKSVTFVVTNRCSLACTYCYQCYKEDKSMSFETAKKFVDLLLSGDKGFKEYIDSPAIILEFIGGEPLLEIELIDKIVDYFRSETLRLNHKWANRFMISICSNGVAYFDKRVQDFLRKNEGRLSFSITLDGDKELHDSCRVFPDGSPSYDYAYSACKDWMDRGHELGSKITLAPSNVEHTFRASKHMLDMGYEQININCVYEEGWELEHAQVLYKQLKKVADYLLNPENGFDLDIINYSIFDTSWYKPTPETENSNWCGGTGLMLACGVDGKLYPCLRYVETSVGNEVEPMIIGNLDEGIAINPKHASCLSCLNAITRRSQSTDECFYCPISSGCGWCSGYNYQKTGDVNKRTTYICDMHKAESLANVYYWNKLYRLRNQDERFEMHCPKEWAIPIIGEEEYSMLQELSKGK